MPPRSRPRKKRRTESDEEIEAAEHDMSSGLTPSTRRLPPESRSIPALSVIAARVIAANFRNNMKANQYRVERDLKRLPDTLIPKVFAMLSASCPGILSSKFIVEVRFVISKDSRGCEIHSNQSTLSEVLLSSLQISYRG